jgi:hypothetical protein
VRSIVLVLLLAGCASNTHTRVHIGAAGPSGSVSIHTDAAGALALLVGAAIVANNLYPLDSETGFLSTSSRYVPELDPSRRVSEQDCSKPIDFTRGNIRCK